MRHARNQRDGPKDENLFHLGSISEDTTRRTRRANLLAYAESADVELFGRYPLSLMRIVGHRRVPSRLTHFQWQDCTSKSRPKDARLESLLAVGNSFPYLNQKEH